MAVRRSACVRRRAPVGGGRVCRKTAAPQAPCRDGPLEQERRRAEPRSVHVGQFAAPGRRNRPTPPGYWSDVLEHPTVQAGNPMPKIDPMLPSADPVSTPSPRQRSDSSTSAKSIRSCISASATVAAPGTERLGQARPQPLRRPVGRVVVEALTGRLAVPAVLVDHPIHHVSAGCTGISAPALRASSRIFAAEGERDLVRDGERADRVAGLQRRLLHARRRHTLGE